MDTGEVTYSGNGRAVDGVRAGNLLTNDDRDCLIVVDEIGSDFLGEWTCSMEVMKMGRGGMKRAERQGARLIFRLGGIRQRRPRRRAPSNS